MRKIRLFFVGVLLLVWGYCVWKLNKQVEIVSTEYDEVSRIWVPKFVSKSLEGKVYLADETFVYDVDAKTFVNTDVGTIAGIAACSDGLYVVNSVGCMFGPKTKVTNLQITTPLATTRNIVGYSLEPSVDGVLDGYRLSFTYLSTTYYAHTLEYYSNNSVNKTLPVAVTQNIVSMDPRISLVNINGSFWLYNTGASEGIQINIDKPKQSNKVVKTPTSICGLDVDLGYVFYACNNSVVVTKENTWMDLGTLFSLDLKIKDVCKTGLDSLELGVLVQGVDNLVVLFSPTGYVSGTYDAGFTATSITSKWVNGKVVDVVLTNGLEWFSVWKNVKVEGPYKSSGKKWYCWQDQIQVSSTGVSTLNFGSMSLSTFQDKFFNQMLDYHGLFVSTGKVYVSRVGLDVSQRESVGVMSFVDFCNGYSGFLAYDVSMGKGYVINDLQITDCTYSNEVAVVIPRDLGGMFINAFSISTVVGGKTQYLYSYGSTLGVKDDAIYPGIINYETPDPRMYEELVKSVGAVWSVDGEGLLQSRGMWLQVTDGGYTMSSTLGTDYTNFAAISGGKIKTKGGYELVVQKTGITGKKSGSNFSVGVVKCPKLTQKNYLYSVCEEEGVIGVRN